MKRSEIRTAIRDFLVMPEIRWKAKLWVINKALMLWATVILFIASPPGFAWLISIGALVFVFVYLIAKGR